MMIRYYFRANVGRDIVCVDTYMDIGELLRIDEQLRMEYDLEGSRPFYEAVTGEAERSTKVKTCTSV